MTLSKLAESAFPDEIRRERAAIGEAVAVVKASDLERLEDAMEQIDGNVYRGWRRFFLRLIREQAAVSDDMRTAWLRSWIMSGDHIRQETNDDLLLASALRVLLPRYQGPAVTLYRGDGALNRKRRTYGLAWTADRDVAQARAEDVWRTAKGGSVLLETHAPASAIICAAHLQDDDRYGEIEYLVDRRRLVAVTVLRRFSQISHAELRMRTARRLKEQRPLPSDTRTHSHERA